MPSQQTNMQKDSLSNSKKKQPEKRVELMAMTMRPVNSKFSKQNRHLSLLKAQISLPDTDAAPDNAPVVCHAHIPLKRQHN